jgi:hypothetical protein
MQSGLFVDDLGKFLICEYEDHALKSEEVRIQTELAIIKHGIFRLFVGFLHTRKEVLMWTNGCLLKILRVKIGAHAKSFHREYCCWQGRFEQYWQELSRRVLEDGGFEILDLQIDVSPDVFVVIADEMNLDPQWRLTDSVYKGRFNSSSFQVTR